MPNDVTPSSWTPLLELIAIWPMHLQHSSYSSLCVHSCSTMTAMLCCLLSSGIQHSMRSTSSSLQQAYGYLSPLSSLCLYKLLPLPFWSVTPFIPLAIITLLPWIGTTAGVSHCLPWPCLLCQHLKTQHCDESSQQSCVICEIQAGETFRHTCYHVKSY